MGRNFTWKKEKLKSRKRIEQVFKEGKSFALFPYRVYFLLEAAQVGPASHPLNGAPDPTAGTGGSIPDRGSPTDCEPTPDCGSIPDRGPTTIGAPTSARGPHRARGPLHAGFGASKRNFKRAVDRNRIKRLSREGYRLQKEPLLRRLEEKGLSMAVFFIYTGRDLPDYPTVAEKIGVALHKLIKEIR